MTARGGTRAGPPVARRDAILAFLGLTLWGRRAASTTLEVPPERQAVILARALSYDTELPARAGSEILIGTLTRPGHAASEAMGAGMEKAFVRMATIKVQGRALLTRRVSYAGAAALADAVTRQGIDALYVCAGLDADLPAIIDLARKRKFLTLGSHHEQVVRGLSLGVFAVEGKPVIVLNLTAARNEGASFSPELLRVARVIR